jgi:hypothetical protein
MNQSDFLLIKSFVEVFNVYEVDFKDYKDHEELWEAIIEKMDLETIDHLIEHIETRNLSGWYFDLMYQKLQERKIKIC